MISGSSSKNIQINDSLIEFTQSYNISNSSLDGFFISSPSSQVNLTIDGLIVKKTFAGNLIRIKICLLLKSRYFSYFY